LAPQCWPQAGIAAARHEHAWGPEEPAQGGSIAEELDALSNKILAVIKKTPALRAEELASALDRARTIYL
jgi:hypothetical protein